MLAHLLRAIRLGFRSTLRYKLRSFLTILGILIGVVSVVWLLAIGEGISDRVQEQIRELGATNIMVRSIKPPEETSDSDARRSRVLQYGITRRDYARIVSTIPVVVQHVPIRQMNQEVRYLHRTLNCRVVGSTAEYFRLNHLRLARGRLLTQSDLEKRANHAVLGYTTAEKLFPYEDPIGRSVTVRDTRYTVVGITAERTPSAAIGGSLAAQDFNLDFYLPITTLRARVGDQVITSRAGSFEGEEVELSQVTLTVGAMQEVMETKEMIEMLLQRFHPKVDYAVVAPLELLEQARVMQLVFNVFLGLIATISLVVGGIGIMNIMLATVTERTREIGVRRALGAKQRDITRQFLIETTVLSALGGAAGAVCGVGCYPVVVGLRHLLAKAFPDAWGQLPPMIQSLEPSTDAYWWSIPMAFLIAVAVGVIFGLYPARRAARMDPIEALRHE